MARVSQLPTTPAALETMLVDTYEGGTTDTTQTTFAMAASILEEAPSAALRVAVFQMIGTLPGISVGGSAVVGGVNGTVLSLTDASLDNAKTSIVIDPTTGTILEANHLSTPSFTTDPNTYLWDGTTTFTPSQVVPSISSTSAQ